MLWLALSAFTSKLSAFTSKLSAFTSKLSALSVASHNILGGGKPGGFISKLCISADRKPAEVREVGIEQVI